MWKHSLAHVFDLLFLLSAKAPYLYINIRSLTANIDEILRKDSCFESHWFKMLTNVYLQM